MKRRILSILFTVLILISVFSFTSCKKDKTPENPEEKPPASTGPQNPPEHTHLFGTAVAEKAATCLSTGNKAYKECTSCKKKFDDAGNELTDVVLPKNPDAHSSDEHDFSDNEDGTHDILYACCGNVKTETVPCVSEITYTSCTRTERCICGSITKAPNSSHTLSPKPGDPLRLECTVPGCDHEEDAE